MYNLQQNILLLLLYNKKVKNIELLLLIHKIHQISHSIHSCITSFILALQF